MKLIIRFLSYNVINVINMFNLINLVFCEKFKILGLEFTRFGDFVQIEFN